MYLFMSYVRYYTAQIIVIANYLEPNLTSNISHKSFLDVVLCVSHTFLLRKMKKDDTRYTKCHTLEKKRRGQENNYLPSSCDFLPKLRFGNEKIASRFNYIFKIKEFKYTFNDIKHFKLCKETIKKEGLKILFLNSLRLQLMSFYEKMTQENY